MRKTIPLIVLAILFASLPSAQADPDIETLWCSSFVDSRLGWTRTGGSPYLGDTDADYISTKADGQTEGDFGFADLSSAGSITSVTLYIECYGDDAPADDSFDVWVYDGSSWTNEGNIAPSTLAWGTYETLDLSTKLDTDVKVDNAQVYFMFSKAKGADDVYIRRAYLYVDYTPTPEGTNYERDVTQAVSWSGVAEREWTLTREVSTNIVVTTNSLRTWVLSRVLSQTLSFASNIVANIIHLFKRSVALGVELTTNAIGNRILLRELYQSISLAVNSGRLGVFSRDVSQSMSLVSNALGGLLSLIERTVSLSINTAFISAQLWQPDGNPDENPDGDTPSVFNVVNEFNTSMIMMNVLTVLATGVYLFMGRDFAWGAVATFLWFVTALAMLVNDPSNWVSARVYGAFGSIFVVLTIVSVVRRLNPEEEYFDDWG